MRSIPIERILRTLGETGEIDEAVLAERLSGTSQESARAVALALRELASLGLVSEQAGLVRLVERPGLVVGRLRCTMSGRCFVPPILPAGGRDVSVRATDRNGALHGDLVVVRTTRRVSERHEGEILAVLERATDRVIGRFGSDSSGGVVAAFDERRLREVLVAPAECGGARVGDVVVATVDLLLADGRTARGRIVEVLGHEGDPGIDVEIIVRKHGLPHVFPLEALAESEAVPAEVRPEDIAGRLDLRHSPTVTIDGETARDFDDAITIERTAHDRWLLGVHIADVSHYVREETPLDHEARLRGTSVYFPDRAVPMLPERLSTGICSLNPGVARLTMSAMMTVDAHGEVLDYWLGPSVILSDERMTYTAVHEILTRSSADVLDRYRRLVPMLEEMEQLARVLIARRDAAGAVDFDLPEPEIELDGEGRVVAIRRAERTIANRIIEQFMILANETVARHLTANGYPLVYRIHELPDARKVDEFVAIANAFGHGFSPRQPPSPADFQWLARRIAGTPEERLLSMLMLRSLPQARYAATNRGHFGLATDCYCHFTSPIRRYPDLVVHRVLRESLERGTPGVPNARRDASAAVPSRSAREQLEAKLQAISDEASERERAADEAEREMVQWKRADLLAERLGDELEAVVVEIKESGLVVELREVFVVGFVHVSSMTDDYYVFKERTHSLHGTDSGRVFRLGNEVVVRVDRVDRHRELVELSVVEGGGR